MFLIYNINITLEVKEMPKAIQNKIYGVLIS